MLDPTTLKIPTVFESERLLIRVPTMEDVAEINAATCESLAELLPWMAWIDAAPSLQNTRENLKQSLKRFEQLEDIRLLAFVKSTGELAVSSGLHNPDWDVPSFEIGYWIRTKYAGKGYVTEAVEAILAFAFEHLQARRVCIKMDNRNERSWRVAERLGLRHEATLYNHQRCKDGSLRHTRIYAQIKPEE